jgi:hypothetical protein
MSSSEVRNYLHVSQSVLNGLEKNGKLKPRRILPTSHKRLYAREDVETFEKSIINN